MLLSRAASRRELVMNQSPERNPRDFEQAIAKFLKEKPLSERIDEPGKDGPSLPSQIPDRPTRPKG
jgi:hypothetical protein